MRRGSRLLLCATILVFLRIGERTFSEEAHSPQSRLRLNGQIGTLSLDDETYAQFNKPSIGDLGAEARVTDAGDGWHRVAMTWSLADSVAQDELAVEFDVDLDADFWWAPHLAPRDGDAIAQHVFRSPALIASAGTKTLVVVPDLGLCGRFPDAPWFMDLDARAGKMWVGMTKTKVWTHVGYQKVPGMVLPKGKVEFAFFVTAYDDNASVPNPWSKVSHFLWERYARPLYAQGQPTTAPLDRYVEHTYAWAFDRWKEAVWQEFEIGGRKVGAPAFIVNYTQSPNYPGEASLREYLSIWNQAWFSSLRSASGVMRYAQRTQCKDLQQKAELTKELALAAPMRDGIFPTVYRTEMERVDVSGRKVVRSKGWQTGFWANSNRVPRELGITEAWYHVLDCSWTALLMLRWHEELQADPRLVTYARDYADKLLKLQDDDGFFPAWLDPESLEPNRQALPRSPETSMSVTFLLKLADVTGEKRYRKSALKALDAVLAGPVAEGRWYDYETFWSCCRFGSDEVGRKYERSGMYKQNTLSMFWTAEACLAAYRVTREERYLQWGRRTLDELSMAQQVWQPPYIYIPALGGFGVMNFDGEWNDSRQTLFAELFMDYYRETGDPHLFERGVAALKSGFIMMYCPENPGVKKLWETKFPFFGPEDYGFTMENYGHVGETSREGQGMGTFTIYDWGNGAASEARNRIRDHYGDVYVDRPRRRAFGIDSINTEIDGNRLHLRDLTETKREIRIVFDDGSTRELTLQSSTQIDF